MILSITRRGISLLAVLTAGASGLLAQADAFGYTATNQTPYSYVNIAGTGTSVLAGADEGTATLTLPFPFRFYGIAYNSACVSSNGLISFGSCVAADFTNLDLTSQSPTGNQGLIAPFWSDLTFSETGTGSVVYQTTGSAPSRRFVIQWNNAANVNVPGTVNFQAILAEGTNNILFQYGSVDSGSAQVNKGAAATVGIRGPSGNLNNNRLQWSYRAPVIDSASAILFTAPQSAAATEVTSQIRVTTSAFVLNRLRNVYTGTVTITNTGSTAIARPITIVLSGLTAGVTAANASGVAPGQGPYYTVTGTDPLMAGQTATVPVQFTNPTNARIGFVVKTYSGAF